MIRRIETFFGLATASGAALRAAFLITALLYPFATQAGSLSGRDDNQQIVDDLEQSIRASEHLDLFTKLDIKNRYDAVAEAAEGYRRGNVPEYDLKEIFNSAYAWMEEVLADEDPALRQQLAQARPALWNLAFEE